MHVILDARRMGEREEAHAYLKRIFSFPEYYGNNLDALYDCLSEMNDLHIHVLHADEAGEYYKKIQSVFDDLDDAAVDEIEAAEGLH